jgi:UDP-3-O-[3-hydroxymyristoyl] glucosamine N-acyltransferase
MMGGQVGVIDHVSIGDGAMIGARGGIMENVPPAGRWAGYPAQPVREWLRGIVALRRFARGGDVGGED